jgi:hypothetical protein
MTAMRTGEVLASPVFLYIAADMVHTAPVDIERPLSARPDIQPDRVSALRSEPDIRLGWVVRSDNDPKWPFKFRRR